MFCILLSQAVDSAEHAEASSTDLTVRNVASDLSGMGQVSGMLYRLPLVNVRTQIKSTVKTGPRL
jgi:hypothetical protein